MIDPTDAKEIRYYDAYGPIEVTPEPDDEEVAALGEFVTTLRGLLADADREPEDAP